MISFHNEMRDIENRFRGKIKKKHLCKKIGCVYNENNDIRMSVCGEKRQPLWYVFPNELVSVGIRA